jgi:integrase
MTKKQSGSRSSKYPNLYRYSDRSPYWIFRKYCSEKRKEFIRSTGVIDSEAQAYKIGLEMFNQWLGTRLDHSGRELFIRDIARAILAAKEEKRDNTYRSTRNQIVNHILPAFGHLKPSQMTPLKWNNYDSEERKKGKRTKLFNTRKALIEILNRAKDEGLIQNIPELKNHDGESRRGKYIDDLTINRILKEASPTTELLIEIVYRMGARPGEVIQWEWDMIHWDEDKFGRIYIPARITKTGRSRDIPLNSRVSELLKRLHGTTDSRFIFPSPVHPDRPVREYKTGWNSACRRAACTLYCKESCEKKCYEKPLDYIIYDLRHTWVTNQAKRRISVVFTAKYADTSIAMIQKIYSKAESQAMQETAG